MVYHAGTHRLATFKKPTGDQWSFLYTNLGHLQKDADHFTYDNDGLLSGVSVPTYGASLTLTRNAQNGLTTNTTAGQVATTHTVNTFGEPQVDSALKGTTVLFRENVSGRDKAGRILARSEEVLAGAATATKLLGYTYDLSGRLERVSENG